VNPTGTLRPSPTWPVAWAARQHLLAGKLEFGYEAEARLRLASNLFQSIFNPPLPQTRNARYGSSQSPGNGSPSLCPVQIGIREGNPPDPGMSGFDRPAPLPSPAFVVDLAITKSRK